MIVCDGIGCCGLKPRNVLIERSRRDQVVEQPDFHGSRIDNSSTISRDVMVIVPMPVPRLERLHGLPFTNVPSAESRRSLIQLGGLFLVLGSNQQGSVDITNSPASVD
jgi:hypothetical protein